MSAYDSAEINRKKQYRMLFLAGGGLFAVIMLVMVVGTRPKVKRIAGKDVKIKTPAETISAEEKWRALSQGEIRELRKSIEELKARRKEDQEKIKRLEERKKNHAKPVLPPPTRTKHDEKRSPTTTGPDYSLLTPKPGRSEMKGTQAHSADRSTRPLFMQGNTPKHAGNRNGVSTTHHVNYQPVEIIEDTIALPVKKVKKKSMPKHSVENYMPAGTFVTGILLSGLDAPTGAQSKSGPVPILIEVTDLGVLPNQWRKDVRACRITAEGYGDLPSERAYIRTLYLSCVKRDGEVLESAIKGYVSGEDGKAGMRGRLVSKQGRMIAKSLMAGTISGIGKGVSQQFTNTITSPLGAIGVPQAGTQFRRGLGLGIGNALEKVANYYLKQAEATHPVIEIGAGRQVTVVLQKGVRLYARKAQTAHSSHGRNAKVLSAPERHRLRQLKLQQKTPGNSSQAGIDSKP